MCVLLVGFRTGLHGMANRSGVITEETILLRDVLHYFVFVLDCLVNCVLLRDRVVACFLFSRSYPGPSLRFWQILVILVNVPDHGPRWGPINESSHTFLGEG